MRVALLNREIEAYKRRIEVTTAYIKMRQWHEEKAYQCLANNLWDNNPGEIDRWENEGGR